MIINGFGPSSGEFEFEMGVKCTLKNQHYIEIQRLLFPRLCSLNFDQPEAQSFFGMQNKRGCSKCRRRKGYSAFRRGSGHDTVDIENLYQWANDPRCPHRKLAREKLERWGFNYRRQCCLLTLYLIKGEYNTKYHTDLDLFIPNQTTFFAVIPSRQ